MGNRIERAPAPLVTVVMPFLNPGRFFREAIESVIAQTWTRWELILVNDGSTDDGVYVANEYVERHPGRILCVTHPGGTNEGISASRNLGISRGKGNYIAFLDGDDTWLPEKLERQVRILEERPEAAMVYSSSLGWLSWQGEEFRSLDWNRSLGVPPDRLVRPPRMVELFLRREAETPGTCSVLARREAIEEVGGLEPEFRAMHEDQVLFFKLCLRFPVFVQSGCWDRYRQHSLGTCHQAERNGTYDPVKPNPADRRFLEWLEGYLAKQSGELTGVSRELKRALWPYRHPVAHGGAVVASRFIKRARRRAKKILPAALGRTARV